MKRGSTSAEIKMQYRAWLLVAHTDKGGDATQFSEDHNGWRDLMS